ncbi:triple tyrosine motif-containing protein [Marinoscillum sp. MHG1-6]|uniref:helix-turn-helix and ligand-binding sensor domain-containing protein n=1 Tax=Marinoscillum sp. MHG1-6 TaxID=2959627 RepID=UPI002157A6CE|nr:triple tyrosine motif-containing protein [Marinoscillum sp. MHG1-6]
MKKYLIVVVCFLSFLQSKGQLDGYEYFAFPDVRANDVIKGIYKDTTGYLWLATDLGVISYNGKRANVHVNGLQNLYAKKFIQLPDGGLIVIHDSGVQRIINLRDSVIFQPLKYFGLDLEDQIFYTKSTFVDSKEVLWFGEGNAIVRVDDQGLNRYVLGINNNYHRSFSFAEDAFGHIWMVSFNGQFLVWNDTNHKLDTVNLKLPFDNEFTSITAVHGDKLLIGSNEGPMMLKVDSDKQVQLLEVFEEPKYISTVESVKDMVVIGTWDRGLYSLLFEKDQPALEKYDVLEFNDVVDIFYSEQEDEIWVAGAEDIALLKQRPIVALGETGVYRVESFDINSKRDVFFTTGEEIYREDCCTGSKELLKAVDDAFFTTLFLRGQELWYGDHLGRVSKLNLLTGTEEIIFEPEIDFNMVNFIIGIGDDLWVANTLIDAVKIDSKGQVKVYEDFIVSVFREAPNGEIFASGNGKDGLLYFYDSKKSDEFIPVDISLDTYISENIRVEDIAFSEGQIYLATNEGVITLTPTGDNSYSGTIIQFAPEAGSLSCRAIVAIESTLWIGTNNGLYRYENGQTLHFTPSSGLPSKLIKQRGFSIDQSILTIATAKGMAQLDMSKIKSESTHSPIIESFLVNGVKLLNSSGRFTIPYQSNIEIGYRCITFTGNEIQYKTRVVGINKEWSGSTHNEILSLVGMSQGDYYFQVQAKVVGGLWSEPASISFRVLSPWYMRWWSYMLFFLLAVTIVWSSIRIYHYHLINQKRKLKRLIDQATAEIEKQKNEIIVQQKHIIGQKEELLQKSEAVYKAQQALTDADLKYLQLKETQLQDQIEYRNKQITTHALNIIQKNETLQALKHQLEKLLKKAEGPAAADIRRTIRQIDESFKLDKDWEDFKLYFEQIYTGFYAKLKAKCPELTGQDLRHCALIRLNLSIQECASIMGISPESVKVSRTRIRKKINIEGNQGLPEFIYSI